MSEGDGSEATEQRVLADAAKPGGRPFDAAAHCGAHLKHGDGIPCRQPKGMRTNHLRAGNCWLHGGRTPNGQQHASREAAAAALEKLGVPVRTDPQHALLEQVWEAAGNVAFLRAQVQELAEVHGLDHLGDGRPHVLVTMYGEERDRLAKVAKLAIDAKISAEFVAIAKRQGEAIALAINAVLDGLGLDAVQRERGRVIAGTQLRLLSGGMAA